MNQKLDFKPGQLNKEYREKVIDYVEKTMEFLVDRIEPTTKYSSTNICLNVLICSLMRVLYISVPKEKREDALKMVTDQLRENFIENDRLNNQ
jgi:Asp-tRNA(Asn)/Glu-tRNA(Gln) amidotransferase C subunit